MRTVRGNDCDFRVLAGVLSVLIGGALFGLGCGGEEGAAAVAPQQSKIEVVDSFPSAGVQRVSIEFVNRGEGLAEVNSATIDVWPGNTGSLELISAPDVGTQIDVGESVTIEVEVQPDSAHPGGCSFAIQGEAVLAWSGEGVFDREARTSIWFGGECDSALRCTPVYLEMDDVKVGRASSAQFSCRNISGEVQILSDASFLSGNQQYFDMELWPASGEELAPDAEVTATVEVVPTRKGEIEMIYSLSTEDGEPFHVHVVADPSGVWEMCSSSSAPTAQIPEEIDGYTFDLESPDVQSFSGQLVDTAGVSDSYVSLISMAYLIADGSFLNDYCETTTSGTRMNWSGVSCDDGFGTLFNMLPIALSEEVEQQIDLIEMGDRVQFEGYIANQIIREGTWNDGGHTGSERILAMLTTRICHP